MKIAIAQMRLSEDMAANLNKTMEKIEAAAAQGADLILFPEIQLSPFFPKHPGQDASRYRMSMDSPQLKAVQRACAAHHIFASPNFYMAIDGKTYDTSFLIDDTGAILGT
jgi:predicted amidohydrolase